MTATVTTVPGEYWRNRVDVDGVFAVVLHVPKPQEQEKREDDRQPYSGSYDQRRN